MKYIFGPVNSRRLGRSLGIDLFQTKTCNFDCIYCEVGPNSLFTDKRKEYAPVKEILAEIDAILADGKKLESIDVFTLTASGEPTLHSGLEAIISYLKTNTDKPVVVITNGSLLHRKEVRDSLLLADIVIPSLDAVLPDSFRKINRPVSGTDLERIITGLEVFAKEFKGKIWLEILLVKGVNDRNEDIVALNKILQSISPDRIQLNTVARPPLEKFAVSLSNAEMIRIKDQLSGPVEIIASFNSGHENNSINVTEKDIVDLIKRRPCTAKEISQALNLDIKSTDNHLKLLLKKSSITKTNHNDNEYYQTTN
ncbi:MAG: radical SAM protein [Proteobacteria bacterium]|nr:radical SAM protein [Pseudomonadota bacterium]